MNIRRFTAPDMRGALAAIRAELGADAVMLSSRRLGDGVEVIAAIDYDDSLLATFGGRDARDDEPARGGEQMRDAEQARDAEQTRDAEQACGAEQQRGAERSRGAATAYAVADDDADELDDAADAAVGRAGGYQGGGEELSEYERLARAFAHDETAAQQADDDGIAARSARVVRELTERAAAVSQTAPAASSAARAEDDAVVVEELKDLRRLLEMQLASLAWNEMQRRTPVRARMLRELAKLGIDAKLATELADAVPTGLDSQRAMRTVMRMLGERLPLVREDIAETGGVFALVGPTGVGKTTTIAKIAARAVLKHGVDSVGLISTDTYRIGARQQLQNFARILRTPLHVAENALELGQILDSYAKKKLVLIDTAGMSQRDVRLASQFATLRVEGHRIRTVLVLSAAADRGCLTQALGVFKQAEPESLVVTKLDEATALGGVLSLALANGLPIAYVADGQRVPEDLHLAAPKRFWLLHNAVKLTLDPIVSPDENDLAEAFGQRELAANA